LHDASRKEYLLHLCVWHGNSRKVRPRYLRGTSLEVIENRQKAVRGVWAQPIVARRSPAGPRSGPRSEDRGGEVPAPERPQRGPGSLDRGQGRPQIPLSSPPALLKPHFDSRTVKHSSANKRGAKPLKYIALVRESGAPEARFSNGSAPAAFLLIHAALAATAHLVHDVCRWVGRGGPAA
jgi:hypothetical protein